MNNGDWISIAVLGRPRGNRGEVTATALSNKPGRFAQLKSVRVADASLAVKNLDIEEVWHHHDVLIFKFAGIDSISEAEALRGAEVQVPLSERVVLDEGEYFHSDLIGCELRDRASGRPLGKVTGVEEYGGPVLLEIEGGRTLVPFVKAICTSIRPQDGVIEVDLPEGLEDLGKKVSA